MDGGCWFENVSFLPSVKNLTQVFLISGLMVILICRWVDSMGNLHGRVGGINSSAQALLIGSHLVTPFPFQNLLIFMIQNMNGTVILIVEKSPLRIGYCC